MTANEDAAQALERARRAKQHLMELVAEIAEVNGVGITKLRGVYALKLNLARTPARSVLAKLPKEVDGVTVVTETTGEIRAQDG